VDWPHVAAPLVVHFTDQSTGTISDWRWDFGDGSMSSARHPAHTYAGAGTYTVVLAVTGPAGTDVRTKTDFIRVEQPARVYLPVVLRN
jgi:PKD repeat protein